jgi:hypothetical protein
MTFDVLVAVSISTMVFFKVHFIQTTATQTNRFAKHSVSETVICKQLQERVYFKGFPLKQSKLSLHQNDVCKEDLAMTSQDKWTQDSNFNLQSDFHALPLTQVNLWEFEQYKTTHPPVKSCWSQSLSSFYCENNRICTMSVTDHSKTHSLPLPTQNIQWDNRQTRTNIILDITSCLS